uniref:Dienelactone hydrolase n=1 Tax=Paecilomyces divaricatus TaxID=644132 RepID=A0A3G1IHI4_PAEDI|nr:dienelactone hydrolase [Paecilomyces divaricatus]
MSGHNKACLCLPVAVVDDYQAKGRYETVLDTKTYITGPSDASRALLLIYDAFGYSPQLLQGADILAASLNALVVVPDFFKGKVASESWFPPDTEEKKAAIGDWFATAGNFAVHIEPMKELVQQLSTQYPSVSGKWGAFGYCWGGKMVALTSGEGTIFKTSGQTHPGMLSADDVSKINIPHIILASKDEDATAVAECKKVLEGPGKTGLVKSYPDQIHGWMAARANLKDETVRKAFEDGYKTAAEFFEQHL